MNDARDAIGPTRLAEAAATAGGVGAGGEGPGGEADRLRRERDRWRDHAVDLVRSRLIEGGIRIGRANEMADAWAAKVALRVADEAKGGAP